MKAEVEDLVSGLTERYEGDEAEVGRQLLRDHPHLAARFADKPLDDLLDYLSSSHFDVEISGQSGRDVAKSEGDPFDSAWWITRKTVAPDERRRALWLADNNPTLGAALAHGLDEDSTQTLTALARVRDRKKTTEVTKVEKMAASPVREEGADAAEAVARAFAAREVEAGVFGGRYSSRSLRARDPDTGRSYMLKPHDGQSAAAGATEDVSTQPQREVAFWYVARSWGVGEYFPRADLIKLDDEEYACVELLPRAFRPLGDLVRVDPTLGQRLMLKYLADGLLHFWGLLDYVLGNPDRHDDNLMSDRERVRLIDQGSAFAGDDFDPAEDRLSFVPYYLRAWSPRKFNTLPTGEKLRSMPRLSHADEAALRARISTVDYERTSRWLTRYGVADGPVRRRWEKVTEVLSRMPADLAILKMWVG